MWYTDPKTENLFRFYAYDKSRCAVFVASGFRNYFSATNVPEWFCYCFNSKAVPKETQLCRRC